MENRFSPTLALTGLAFFAATVICQTLAVTRTARRKAYLNPPPEHLELFTFGFRESLADGVWLRWIQDGDACQTYAGVEAAPVSVDPAVADDFRNPRTKICDNSWSFKMLDAVSTIAPRFKMPYLAGTMTLAVLVEDYAGATRLFEKALVAYPDDWQILYRAGYHYLFDVRDLPRAADLMKRAADAGAPYWVHLLSARLYTRAGQANLGIATLVAYMKTVEDPERRKLIEKRIVDLRRAALAEPRPGAKGP